MWNVSARVLISDPAADTSTHTDTATNASTSEDTNANTDTNSNTYTDTYADTDTDTEDWPGAVPTIQQYLGTCPRSIRIILGTGSQGGWGSAPPRVYRSG